MVSQGGQVSSTTAAPITGLGVCWAGREVGHPGVTVLGWSPMVPWDRAPWCLGMVPPRKPNPRGPARLDLGAAVTPRLEARARAWRPNQSVSFAQPKSNNYESHRFCFLSRIVTYAFGAVPGRPHQGSKHAMLLCSQPISQHASSPSGWLPRPIRSHSKHFPSLGCRGGDSIFFGDFRGMPTANAEG